MLLMLMVMMMMVKKNFLKECTHFYNEYASVATIVNNRLSHSHLTVFTLKIDLLLLQHLKNHMCKYIRVR